MVVAAAIPLLVELGPSVTTAQIARAAGISEPTIFRAFTDKNEVLAACMAEVTDGRHVADELAAIERDVSLHDRLTAVIEVIRAQSQRTAAVINAVSLAGQARLRQRESMSDEERNRLPESRTESYTRLRDTVVGILESDDTALRTSAEEAATLILAIVLSLGRGGGWDTGAASVTTAGLVEMILHGITA
ncbi:TetR/AcrR family transcriptional regulator [Nocardia callitridis]|uniref:TetR/AcrR family transcriptional regulator n=2 Tax=Nocardia callitridis TaxID=648753 RepID=A0ABP9KR91_9NOCA